VKDITVHINDAPVFSMTSYIPITRHGTASLRGLLRKARPRLDLLARHGEVVCMALGAFLDWVQLAIGAARRFSSRHFYLPAPFPLPVKGTCLLPQLLILFSLPSSGTFKRASF